MKVVSEPSNATVTMDDKILGTTPLTLQGLPPGSRTLRVSKVGHSTQAVETIVEPGQTASLSAKLSKQANFDGTWMGSYVGKMSDGTIHTNQIRYTFSGTTLHVSCNGIDLPKARCKQIGNQMILSQHGIGTDGGEYHADSTFTMTEDGRSLAVSGSNRFGKTPQFNNTGGGTFRRVE